MGQITNYQGAEGAAEVIENSMEKLILVYNDLGSAITSGDVYHLSYERDADSLTVPARPTLVACATSSVYQHIAVVNNARLGKSTIADKEWGYVQVRGYCPDVKCTTATQAIDTYIQGTNGTQAATTDGASRTTDSFAIMTAAAVDNHGPCKMFGDTCIIG
jgi:hypothetical protein